MREFINGLQTLFNIEAKNFTEFLSTSVSRDVFTSLLQELPSEKIVWKTLDGEMISAQNLTREVYEGTDVGRQYISEVLRIARDMISRKAKK